MPTDAALWRVCRRRRLLLLPLRRRRRHLEAVRRAERRHRSVPTAGTRLTNRRRTQAAAERGIRPPKCTPPGSVCRSKTCYSTNRLHISHKQFTKFKIKVLQLNDSSSIRLRFESRSTPIRLQFYGAIRRSSLPPY